MGWGRHRHHSGHLGSTLGELWNQSARLRQQKTSQSLQRWPVGYQHRFLSDLHRQFQLTKVVAVPVLVSAAAASVDVPGGGPAGSLLAAAVDDRASSTTVGSAMLVFVNVDSVDVDSGAGGGAAGDSVVVVKTDGVGSGEGSESGVGSGVG